MPARDPLSRHRLPRRYRWSLTLLWLTPIVLLLLTGLLRHGLTLALFDLRLVLPLLLMALPALLVWQQGIDVLTTGLVSRWYRPQYYGYDHLATWYLDNRPDKRVLTVWDEDNCKVLECRAGHLSDLPLLLRALKANLRYRHWPN